MSEAVSDEGGDDVKFGGQVRYQEPVVIFSEGIVNLPILFRVSATDGHLQGVHVVTFRGRYGQLRPQMVKFFVVVAAPARRVS